MRVPLIWPWSRFARDLRWMQGMADQMEAATAVEHDLKIRLGEARERALSLTQRGLEDAIKLARLKLDLSGAESQLVTRTIELQNARAEAIRLRAEINSMPRSSQVIYPPTEHSPARLAELEQEMYQQDEAAASPDFGNHPSELDDDLVFTGWPFGSA